MSGKGLSTLNTSHKMSDREKGLRSDNDKLKAEIKELETTYESLQNDLARSCLMRDRLDTLCKELQRQTQVIKEESAAQMHEAEQRGNQLAKEVSSNMGFMESVNDNLTTVTNESLQAKKDNEELIQQISILKKHYDQREEKISAELTIAHNALIQTKTELAQLKLKTAEDKEQFFGEMQKLANALVESRKQMKDAKETELSLRVLIQGYDEKFLGLQTALKETNQAYSNFKGEMEKVGERTKELENETIQWQKKWEESNGELIKMTRNHEQLQLDLGKVHESLIKMTNLYKALEKDRSDLLKRLQREDAV